MAASADIAITGLGMVTSVGDTVEASCAAIRCNLDRPSPIDGTLVWDPHSEEAVPLVGRPIRGVTDGYQGLGRLFRLARIALLDLLRYTELTPGDTSASSWRSCGLLLCAAEPSPERSDVHEDAVRALPERLARSIELPIPPSNIACILEGNRGVLTALATARQKILAGSWERAIVVGVDSYLDEDSLQWLAAQDRLRIPERAVGVIPGEAAAALLLEPPQRAIGAIGACLEGVGLAEAADPTPDTVRLGAALSDAIQRALHADGNGSPIGDSIGDLNGEEIRAMMWGNALSRIDPRRLSGSAPIHPAMSLGDVGAASAAVSLCIAVRSFARGYSSNGRALVWATTETGKAGACVVRAPG